MKLQTTNYELSTKNFLGFTLIELMIVVSILGILAAVVLPEFQSQTQQAKESAAKANLKLLRDAIERYALDHNGIPPGYPSNNPSNDPGTVAFNTQLFSKDYLSARPVNPFNNSGAFKLVGNSESFPTDPVLPEVNGWIYQPATKTIKLNWPGVDSESKLFFDY